MANSKQRKCGHYPPSLSLLPILTRWRMSRVDFSAVNPIKSQLDMVVSNNQRV